MNAKFSLLILALATASEGSASATVTDTTKPTCEVVRTTIVNSPVYPGAYRFTFFVDAADNASLRTYTGTKGPLEFRARIDGGTVGAWTAWPLDYDQPIYIDVDCFFFHFEVRSADTSGNHSPVVVREFAKPFNLLQPIQKATFGVPLNFSSGGRTARGLIAGMDFDGDGHADFVQADHDSGLVKVRLNTAGKGKTFIPVDIPLAANSVDDIASGRIAAPAGSGANDSYPDLVIANNSEITVELNQGPGAGTGSFTALPNLTAVDHYFQYVAVADLNGDGYADIVASASPYSGAVDPATKVAVFINNGSIGGFATPVLIPYGTFCYDLALGDFNGDTYPDIAVVDSGDVKVILSTGPGTFASPVSYSTAYTPRRIAIGDITGDGKRDLVVATEHFNIVASGVYPHALTAEVLANQGAGTFDPVALINIHSANLGAPRNFDCSIAVGDLNGDGRADIIAGSELLTGGKIIHLLPLKNSAGNFLDLIQLGKSTFVSGGKVRALALADLNAKGEIDVVLTNTSDTKQTSILLNATP